MLRRFLKRLKRSELGIQIEPTEVSGSRSRSESSLFEVVGRSQEYWVGPT